MKENEKFEFSGQPKQGPFEPKVPKQGPFEPKVPRPMQPKIN